jgi:hypothetical protein
VAAVVDRGQRRLRAVDPRQRGHHLRSLQDATEGFPMNVVQLL